MFLTKPVTVRPPGRHGDRLSLNPGRGGAPTPPETPRAWALDILVAEDNTNQKLAMRLLEKWSPANRSNGQEAFEATARNISTSC
jgi:hypothetical protein